MIFGTAIIDPPWPYRVPKAAKNGSRAGTLSGQTGYSGQKYDPLSIDDLAALPVGDLVSNIVLLWTTGPHMPAAIHLVEQWGFEYVTMAYWHKTSRSGILHTLSGEVVFRPHWGVGYWFRGDTEPIVVAKRKGTPSFRTGERSTFMAPMLGHSAKPGFLHALVEAHFPGPWLELFARLERPGWTCVGDHLDGRDIRDLLPEMVAA